MKKLFAVLMLIPALALAMDGPPIFVDNVAAAGRHKFYSETPGDLGNVSVVQVTATTSDVQISFHNYTKGTAAASDNAWMRIDMLSYSATQDTSYTVYGGETVEFKFTGQIMPEAFYTSGGDCRVWAR